MSIAEKLTTIAENQQKVFDAGMSKAESDFWNLFQDYGNRDFYEQAFNDSGYAYIRPKYKIVPTSRAFGMFQNCPNLRKVESQYFDLSNCQKNDATSTQGNYCMFDGCTGLEEIEDIGMQTGYYYATFRYCKKLHTVAIMRVERDTKFASAFVDCNALENLTVVGVIGQNGLNVQYSPLLTHESLMSILSALQEKTSGTWAVTLGTENLAKLTDAEKAMATQKGWTLA